MYFVSYFFDFGYFVPNFSSSSSSGDSGTVSESASGKSSPIIFPDHTLLQNGKQNTEPNNQCKNNFTKSSINSETHSAINGIPAVIDSAGINLKI